jgi:hypothetical protein
MIAVRMTWLVKPDCMEQALAFFKASQVEIGSHVVRVYTPRYSPNLLVFEMRDGSFPV